MAALGYESPSGDFEVIDLCYPGIPPHATPSKPLAKADTSDEGSWVAFVSGLSVKGDNQVGDVRLGLLVEYLMGELGGNEVRRPYCHFFLCRTLTKGVLLIYLRRNPLVW